MSYKYSFTVFTPTYNRAHTLHRPYESLKAQTFRDFEWIIVDDGSTDGTEVLVRQWQDTADFPIRYFWQQNAGKHVASNKGVLEAQGELFLTFDSDDECLPAALERFKFHWDSIPHDEKPTFSAVTSLVKDPEGNVPGTRFPYDPTDSDSLETRLKYGVTGEKWGFQRTDVMREFLYPVFEGENLLPASVVWNRIALKYKTRYVNEVLRIYHRSPDSSSVGNPGMKNPQGERLYYREFVNLDYPIPKKLLLQSYVRYVQYSSHAGVGLAQQVRDISSPLYWLAAFPLGYLLHMRGKRSRVYRLVALPLRPLRLLRSIVSTS